MSADPWFAFDPKLSWDGLLTFIGGLLAFVGIFYQVRHADEGLRRQLQAEKEARLQESDERRRAVSIAMLFEIDRFYRFYVKELLKILSSSDQARPPLESPGPTPFPVYAMNCGRIGELDSQLAQALVDFYTSAQRHAFRICDYVDKYNSALAEGGSSLKSRIAEFQLPTIKSGGGNLTSLAYIASGYLCVYTGVPFTPANFDVAHGENMSGVTIDAANAVIKSFGKRIGTARHE